MSKILNNSQVKIIDVIFKNPEINLRGIIEKTRLSPNYVSEYVNSLVEKNILIEKRFEKKKVYLRTFMLNLNESLTKNIFALVYEAKKEAFFEKYPKIEPVLKQMCKIEGIDFLVIYGSYARLAADKESDLDLMIVGKIKNTSKIREILVSLEIEPSIKIESLASFKERINDEIHKQIIKDGIIISGADKFLRVISK